MTQEEKLKEAKRLYETANADQRYVLESLFPELKESEGEKTKRLLHTIANKMSQHLRDIFTEEEFQYFDAWSNAWLEKQKQVKDSANFQHENKMCKENDDSLTNEDEMVRKELLAVTNDLVLPDEQQSRFVTWLEKQSKQKSIDKVKSKFKVGDWIVCCDYEPIQIIGITKNDYYEMSNGDCRPIHMVDNNPNIKLWSITDAKAGDVLVDIYENIGIFEKIYEINWHTYCFLDCIGRFISEGGSHGSTCHPATKEQRKLLFQKMKKAGYKWDSKNKKVICHLK